ncbi:MAG: hypothetical protein JNM22_23535 [Saprospiraceae bacterium]|nr:hypothetical protein [Saprospiraceae bacterium]
MDKQDPIHLLKKIQKVDAPEFMYTRIQARIRIQATEQLPLSWKWAGGLAFGMLLLLNVSLLQRRQSQAPDTAELLISNMNLYQSNQLYHE